MRKWLVGAAIAAAALSGCGGDDSDDRKAVWYFVSVSKPAFGTAAEATVTMRTSSGISQTKTLFGTYSTPVTAEDGQFLYLSAQKGSSEGTVTVEIQVDGKSWKRVSSSAPYGIATVSGTCCSN